MATTELKARLCLKRDSFENWEEVAESFVPLAGEACIVVAGTNSGAVTSLPAVLIKIGDGTNALADLPYASAIAADVYEWAKAAVKPTYAASEITGLSDYISGEIEDTDTQYKIEQDGTDTHKFYLYSKALSADEWTLVSTMTVPDDSYDDAEIKDNISDLQDMLNDLGENFDDLNDAVDTLNGEGEGSVKKTVADQIAEIVANAPEDLDTLKEISDWIASHETDAAGMNSAIKQNASDIEEINAELDTKADADDLADIAMSGNVNDLEQDEGDYIILNCGTATTVI